MRKPRRAGGQSLVEFALAIPIFLLVMIAIFDMGRAVFAYNTLTNAAREGARMAIVDQDTATIIARAKAATAIVELNDPSVTVSFYQDDGNGNPNTGSTCSPVAVGCLAVVSFETTYQPITPIISSILFSSGVTFRAKSVLAVEYQCPNSTFTTAASCPRH